jgi:molybdopterin-biosynthesis enzyme MoeA-like protein
MDIRKKLQQEMQDENTNALSVDTMGAAIRANNEEELGKLYEPKRMIQHEQIKQALSLNDLKLLDNSTNTSNGLLLDINGTDVCTTTGEE